MLELCSCWLYTYGCLVTDFDPINYRSNPSKSKLAPVSVPVSRQSLSLVTQKDTSVSASRRLKKSLQQSVQPSSSPSSASSQFEEGTGVLLLVTHIRCPPRRVGNVALLLFEYVLAIVEWTIHITRIADTTISSSLLPVVPASSHLQLSSVYSNLLVFKMSILPPPALQKL